MAVIECYNFFDRVFLRAPFYSFENYDLGKVSQVLSDPAFRDAVWLASPVYYRELEKKGFDFNLLSEKERFTLYKYYNRMSFRCTPFGAFASCTTAGWSATDRLVLEKKAVLHVLPSWEWLQARNAILKESAGDFLVYSNPSLYRQGNFWRYTISAAGANGKLEFSLQGIAAEGLNNYLIRRSAKAPLKRSELIALLKDRSGCSADDAATYIAFLIAEQILLSEFDGSLLANGLIDRIGTDPGPVENFWNEQRSIVIPAAPGIAERAAKLRDLNIGSGINAGADMFYTSVGRAVKTGGFGEWQQQEIGQAIGYLARLVRPFNPAAMQDFIAAFKRRFEGRRVPILEALDADTGISYDGLHNYEEGNGLLAGLSFPVSNKTVISHDWDAVRQLFLRIWLQDRKRGEWDKVVLREEDLSFPERVKERHLKMPPSLSVLYSRAGDQLVLDNIGGASATALTGRFSVFSGELSAFCRQIALAEKNANPDILFAELHQLSHEHVDNINRRVQIYDYVIALSGYPMAEGSGIVLPADLLLSVRDDDLILESVSLGKRLIPRLPTAYNYHHNETPVFRLLAHLQYQGLQVNFNFDPEKLFPGLPFYPRVEFRRCIFSLAKWILSGEDIRFLSDRPVSLGRLHQFRQERGIPRLVSLGGTDQQLVFDLVNDSEAVFFLDCLRGAGKTVLHEFLPPGGAVSDGSDSFTAQSIAVLLNPLPVYSGLSRSHPVHIKLPQRRFMPGSEWLYIRMECTERSANQLLTGVVVPVIRKNEGIIDQWFFVRYYDPDHHIRLRFKVNAENAGRILSAFHDGFSKEIYRPMVKELRTETYIRELERYGPEIIGQVETFFFASSEWVINYLGMKGYLDARADELLPIILVYRMCGAFFKDQTHLETFLAVADARFRHEFEADKTLLVGMDGKYRQVARDLTRMLEDGHLEAEFSVAGTGLMLQLLEHFRKLCKNWEQARQERLLADLVHMHLNRFFTVRQRQQEGLVYFCLRKYVSSLMVRKRDGFK